MSNSKTSEIQVAAENQFRYRIFAEVMKNLIDKTGGREILLKKSLDQFIKDNNLKGLKAATERLVQNLVPLQEYKKAIRVLTNQCISWRKAYIDIIKAQPQLHHEQFNLDQFLLGFQSKVKFDFQDFTRETTIPNSKYTKQQGTYNLQVNMARNKYGWKKQFVEQWREKKKIHFQQAQNVKQIQHKTDKPPISKEDKPIKKQQQKPKLIKQSKESSKSDKPKKQQTLRQTQVKLQTSTSNKPKQQLKITKTTAKEQPSQTITNNKKIQRSQSDLDDSEENDNESDEKSKTLVKEEPHKTIKSEQEVIDPKPTKTKIEKKNRALVIKNYLENRKDLNISIPQNLVALSQFLNESLQTFMKHILNKVINAAKLRNYNYSKKDAGDEFRYFHKNNSSIKCQIPFSGPINPQIYQLKFPSKLQIYSSLRVKEEEREEKIRYQLNQKRQVDKRKQSKTLDFLLRQREVQTQPWISRSEAETTRLVISNNHVQIVLEDHSWINDGIAMLKSYHF